MIKNDKLLFSIIIPVYNDYKSLDNTLNAISLLSTSKSLYEVVVIDNGSDKDIKTITRKYSFVKIIYEMENKSSPYSARNRGIEVAKGDIIVLLDSTCQPIKEWLNEAMEFFKRSNVHIAGGEVKFNYGKKITASKIYDSMINIKMKQSILEHQICKTANLFVRKEIFDKVGFFPERVRSGADVRWTRRVSKQGYKLYFIETSIVYKKARGFFQLIKKQWRVGVWQPNIWFEEENKIQLRKYFSIFKLLPPNYKKLKNITDNNEYIINSRTFVKIYFVSYVIKMVMFVANIIGLVGLKLGRNI